MEVLMILLFLACLAVLYFKPQKEGLAFYCSGAPQASASLCTW